MLFSNIPLQAQALKGKVVDTENNPVGFANIYIKNTQLGTSSDANGHYYLALQPGNYEVVISSVGYGNTEFPIIIKDEELVKNVILDFDTQQLNEITVKAKGRDPAYEIIQKAIDNRDKNQNNISFYSVNVYLRASEDREQDKINENEEDSSNPGAPNLEITDFEEEQKKEKDTLNLPPNLSVHESHLEVHVGGPDQFKEIKKASKTTGTSSGLFIPMFYRDGIDFYEGLVHPKKITETPWISPLNVTSVLSYKFKLENAFYEEENLIYKIKVTPRKTGNSTLKGYIYIVEGSFNIRKVDLGIKKGGLLFFDEYNLIQEYEKQDDKWLMAREVHNYSTKSWKKEYEGSTAIRYQDYKFDVDFPEDFFGNEVGYAEEDAYEKDTTFWNQNRPEKLTPDQMRAIAYNDSVKAVITSNEYLDSMNLLYNKIKPLDILYFGVGFRNREKKREVRISSLGESINPIEVGGITAMPSISYNKQLEDGRRINFWGNPTVGFRNQYLKGTATLFYSYNSYNFSGLAINYYDGFDFINQNDAYLEMIRRSNFFERKRVMLTHYFEPINGIRLFTRASWSSRKSIEDLNFGDVSERFLTDQQATVFDNHIGFVTQVAMSYTPAQKYYREPNRRIILGSKFPTFTVRHTKGWNNFMTSILDYDYLQFIINQSLNIRSLGNSTYRLETGKFVNTNTVRIIDYKRFRRGDPILFSDPKSTFQLLDQSFEITSQYYEGHYNHRFNGALINNVPFIKLLKIRAAAGTGFLLIPDEDYRYYEFYAGIERIFKLGPRRRLKIGAYGVIGESNRSPIRIGPKISFDIIDTWRTNWNF